MDLKWVLYVILALILLLGMPLCACWAVSTAVPPKPTHGLCILIDPGHGGEDGGAVAADGTAEKNINLAISKDLYDLFCVCGFDVKCTRFTDESLGNKELSAVRQRKVSDMNARLALYNESDVVISVHQNHFSIAKYSGTQVFYSPNDAESRCLAEAIRGCVIAGLQPENHRELKQATDGIYLLYHAKKPAVLVECGFLSNPAELSDLKRADYQQKMAFCVFSGWLTYENSTQEG